MKRLLLTLIKYGISLGIVAYLIYQAARDDTFAKIWDQPKDWRYFVVAWALCMTAACLTMIRWYYLVRALDLPFRIADAFRLGFLGYLLNFVAPGNVGGDFFKAVFIAREQPGNRAQAVATVVVDRVIGLYVLFVVASAAILITGLYHSESEKVEAISRVILALTVVGGILLAALFIPGLTHGRVSQFFSRLPRIGHVFAHLLDAIRLYRSRFGILALTCLLTVFVHVLNTLGIYMVARGLPGDVPSLGAHFIIVSVSMVAGALPFTVSGLGAFEGTMDFLYSLLSTGPETMAGKGTIVAFGYRLVTVVIALVGLYFYLRSRREVKTALAQAEAMAESEAL